MYDARDLRGLYAPRHRGDGRTRRPASTTAPARSTTSGRPASTSSCTTTWRLCSRELAGRGLKLGLISNSHRCLTSFQEHFELKGLIAAAVSSSEHGYMKPHPSIFEAALEAGRRRGRGVGDGGRQPPARHRGCAARRDARECWSTEATIRRPRSRRCSGHSHA